MTKVHFLGIGGSGTSAAAAIAQSQGYEVTGCDKIPNNEFTTQFTKDQLFKGHDPSHLEAVDILAITPAITSLDKDNPELVAAKEKEIEVLTWQEFTGKYLMKDKFVIAVAGTHGKTTTTAMIAKILEDLGEEPTVLIGAIVSKWGTNYRLGKKPNLDDAHVDENYVPKNYFVLEADEFNDNFLNYKADIAVVTNIEMDHPEYFKSFEHYKQSFYDFLLKTERIIVANLTDPAVAEILKDVMKESSVTSFDYTKSDYHLNLKVPGDYNHLNANAAYCVGLMLGLDPDKVKASLESYEGVSRRFEHIGQFNGVEVYSDFGHHPTEIKTTMEAARQKFPGKKLILIYEPHMFTRTKALFDDFVKVFKEIPVDKIIVTDIYPSREVDTGIVSSQQLVDSVIASPGSKSGVNSAKQSSQVVYIPKNQLINKLKEDSPENTVLFFMGAGDIDQFGRKIIAP
jgi:UDP-N-acetylmuramate--alanine ligase